MWVRENKVTIKGDKMGGNLWCGPDLPGTFEGTWNQPSWQVNSRTQTCNYRQLSLPFKPTNITVAYSAWPLSININHRPALIDREGNGTHSSTLAWKIPWAEEPGRLQSMGLLRVGHDWETSLSLFTFMHWRRKWQPTPVFLPGDSQGRGSLVGCRLWGHTESDTTEVT